MMSKFAKKFMTSNCDLNLDFVFVMSTKEGRSIATPGQQMYLEGGPILS